MQWLHQLYSLSHFSAWEVLENKDGKCFNSTHLVWGYISSNPQRPRSCHIGESDQSTRFPQTGHPSYFLTRRIWSCLLLENKTIKSEITINHTNLTKRIFLAMPILIVKQFFRMIPQLISTLKKKERSPTKSCAFVWLARVWVREAQQKERGFGRTGSWYVETFVPVWLMLIFYTSVVWFVLYVIYWIYF